MNRVPLVGMLTAALVCGPVAGQQPPENELGKGDAPVIEASDPAFALEHLHLAEGFEVSLFASEQDFPIDNPVALTFDARGRLWVATMPSYPQRLPDEEPDDKIVILEDRDGDGRADHHTVFARGLYQPTGFELGDGGAYVAQQPNLMFIEDTDGDDVADRYEAILQGFGTEDSHHAISAFAWGPGGGLYFQEGRFHNSQVETPYGTVRLVNAGVFRYEPARYHLEVFVSYPFANPWGHVFDRWGQNFITDGSAGKNYFGAPLTGYAPYPAKQRAMKPFTAVHTPGCASEIVSSRHFPDGVQGNYLVTQVRGLQGIRQHRVIETGSGFTSEESEPLLYSTDDNFRPVDLQFGPDGALYVVDWFNPAIGHDYTAMRSESRDHEHGRIWRVRHSATALLEAPEIEGASTRELVRLLETYEDRTRYRVRRELRERPRGDVLAALRSWRDELDERESGDASAAGLEHHRLEALWLYQSLGVVEADLLDRMLSSMEPRARAAASRVVRFWRRELDDPLALLAARVGDASPRTRLEAVVGLGFLGSEAAAEAALKARDHPMDDYLNYVLKATVDTLKSAWMPGLEREPALLNALSPTQGDYLLSRLATGELEGLPAHTLTDRAVLRRGDASVERQRQALKSLTGGEEGAPSARESRAVLLAGELQRLDRARPPEPGSLDSIVRLLLEQDAASLLAARDAFESLARSGTRERVRSAAMAALMVATGDSSRSHFLPGRPGPEQLTDWLRAVDQLPPALRVEAYPSVSSLLEDRGGRDRRVVDAAALTLAGITLSAGRGFERLASLVSDPSIGIAALEGLGALTANVPDAWPADAAEEKLVGPVLAAMRKAPPGELASPRYRRIQDLGLRIADRLIDRTGDAVGGDLREELVNLAAGSVTLRTVPYHMVFDIAEFTVRSGRPVEISFENTDVKPHNVTIVRPGALDEVGRAADDWAERDPVGAEAASYVPETPLVVLQTGMVHPGETEVLRFDAPQLPGLYAFACTFPGHWVSMNGTMRVVERLEGSATTRYAAPRLAPRTARRAFVADWSYEMLEIDVAPLDAAPPPGDEQLERGRQLFFEAGCTSCHARGGVGGGIGPALDGVGERFTALEVLRHIVQPSDEVGEEYRMALVATRDGRFQSGLLVDAGSDAVRIRSNPRDPSRIESIPRADIERLDESPLSPMPSGLLGTLQPSEVQDLIRYVRHAP